MLAAVREQFLASRRLPGCRSDEGRDLLTPRGIWHTDHRHVRHGRVRKQELLDLTWVDVLPTADDHLLEPSLDEAIAALVHRTQVAGVQPAISVNRRGA